MSKVLVSLHHLVHKQWDHRNQVKVKTNNPQEQQAVADLDRKIKVLWLTKQQELHPEDRHSLKRNLLQLLSRSKTSKQRWFSRFMSARQKFIRDREHDRELQVIAREQSPLWQWLATQHYSG